MTAKRRNPLLIFNRGGTGLQFPLKDLPEIKIQRRKNKAKSNLQEWNMMGADTETIEGRVWLFSTELGVWEIPTFAHLMHLLYSNSHTRKWKKGGGRGRRPYEYFFWNLKFDAQAVLRMLTDRVVLALINSHQEEGDIGTDEVIINADTGDFKPKVRGRMVKLSYLEGKSLMIKPINWRRGKVKLGPCYWWDISQFFGKMRLNTASQKYLNDSKIERCFDGSILDASRFDESGYRDYYREDIDKYAVQDAVLTGKLARLKRAEFIENNIRFIRPYSLANVAQRNLLDTCTIPTINRYNSSEARTILTNASTSFSGGWFETTGSGYHPSISMVDLASAYPYILYHLPDCDENESAWFAGDGGEEFEEWLNYRKPYSLGFVEAYFLFTDDNKWNPLVTKSRTGTLVTPRMFRGWITADELIEARKWPYLDHFIGKWCYFDPETDSKPFQPFIDRFYELKVNAGLNGDKVAYGVSKTMINSIYGKTVQAIDGKAGKLWNPLYASTITGATRARLAELIRVNDYNALSVATDGVIFPSDKLHTIPNRPLPAPHNLGQWELEDEGELLSLMSGVYSIRNENSIKTTFRGSASYFLRNYRESGIFGFCKDNFQDYTKSASIRRPYSLREARIKGDLSLTNVFSNHTYSLNALGVSTKRLWGGETPEKFGDLLNRWYMSTPHQQV